MATTNSTESIEREMLRLAPGLGHSLCIRSSKAWANLSENELESLWLNEAERRDIELESGSVKAVPGDEVINSIRSRHGF
jgi:hypothetical protein